MAYFTEPEEALDYVYALLNDNKEALGLGFVGYGEERLLPVYPAAVVSFNVPVDRELYATRTFRLQWVIQIEVYHAKLTVGHKTRTREDMALAASIRNKLHEDYTFGNRVVFGFVRSERPGVVADGKGRANVATVLVWSGESRAAL